MDGENHSGGEAGGAMEEEELLQLLWKLKDPKKGVLVKDRKSLLKTYKQCFVGKEMVDWLIAGGFVMSREEAVSVGIQLAKKKLLAGVNDKHDFRDEGTYYRWIEPSDDAEDNKKQQVAEETRIKFRVCVLGGAESGKSAFCNRFSTGQFLAEYKPTTNDEYFRKENWNFREDNITMEVLDTAAISNEDLETKLAKCNEWATGFLLVYSITSRASFELIPKLFTTLIKIRQFKMTPILLVGTRADMEEERKVTLDEGKKLAMRYRCRFAEISAKTGQNINEAWLMMADTISRIQFIAGPVKHKTGWIRMRKVGKPYKKRYLVMTDSGLRYYSEEPPSLNQTSTLKGVIPMLSCQVEILPFLISTDRRNSDPEVGTKQKGKTKSDDLRSDTLRRMSDQFQRDNSNSGSNPPSPDPRAEKRLNRQGSFSSTGSSASKAKKLNILLVDSNEVEYELQATTEEERDEWYKHLCRAVEKANMQSERPTQEQETLDLVTQDPSTMTEEEIMAQAALKFNKNPNKGMKFLIQAGKVANTPADVAKFLSSQKIFKKTALGEYLGDISEFNVEVLREYLELIDLENVEFDEALRLFLTRFTLPGEAQKIDRIMEKFAGRYCKCNPTVFETPDVGYILAFSLIMLNTDAHNPSIKPENKMTKPQFVSNNRGINNGKDVAREYLEDLYDRIVQKEIKMEYERDDFSQWDKQGYIYVRESKGKLSNSQRSQSLTNSGKKGGAKKLWCIISTCCLYIFENPQDKKPLHIIPLGNLQIDSLFEDKEKNSDEMSGFVLYHPDPKDSIRSAVDGKEVHLRELHFYCENRKAKMEWMLTFKLNLVSAPNYKQ